MDLIFEKNVDALLTPDIEEGETALPIPIRPNEIETVGDELSSANQQLKTYEELGRLTDDVANLLSSTSIPILMLDDELRIRRFTAVAQTALNIRQSDVGRRIGTVPMLAAAEPLIRSVIETSQPTELELRDHQGRWRMLRVRPYRASSGRINGAVLLFIDIDELRTARVAADSARQVAESIVESIKTPLVVLCEEFRLKIANAAFYEDYGLQRIEVHNQPFFEINSKQWDVPGLRAALEQVKKERVAREGLEFEVEISRQSKSTVCIGLRPVVSPHEGLILIVIDNITQRKQAERMLLEEQRRLRSNVEMGSVELHKAGQMLQNEALGREQVETALHASEYALLQSREELRHLSASLMNAQDAERRRVSRELHDDLSQKVAKLQFDIEILEQKVPFTDVRKAKERLRDLVNQAAGLSNDLRRVAYQLHPATLDHLGLSVALQSYIEEFSRSTAIPVKFTSSNVPREIPIELASGLYRIVQEALRNIGKHASTAQVEIALIRNPMGLALSVRDNGEGFDIEAVRVKGGLGLISMQERVRLLNGVFAVETRPGAGVQISIQCPLPKEQS